MTIHSLLIQKLLSTNAHIGRRITTNHIKPYAFGSRNGLTILDSDKTLIALRAALSFLSSLLRRSDNNARFLFVNTNPLHDLIVEHMRTKIGIQGSQEYWRLTGFLTNNSSPKKFKSRRKKLCFAPPVAPHCVVLLDAGGKGKGRSAVVNEATRLGVPIVGLVDSSAEWKTFSKTFLYEKKRMKEEADVVEGGDVGLKGRIMAAVDESLKNSSSSSSNSSSSAKEEMTVTETVMILREKRLTRELLYKDEAKAVPTLLKFVMVPQDLLRHFWAHDIPMSFEELSIEPIRTGALLPFVQGCGLFLRENGGPGLEHHPAKLGTNCYGLPRVMYPYNARIEIQ
ncbi:Small ribosomal subunit protein uS2m-like protein [Drosera capensis]